MTTKLEALNVGDKFKLGDVQYEKTAVKHISCCTKHNVVNLSNSQGTWVAPETDVEVE